MPEQARQSCPNCGAVHDVSVYVSGQRLRCRCGLHFAVERADVRRSIVSGPGRAASVAAPPGPPVPTRVDRTERLEKPGPPVASGASISREAPRDGEEELAPTAVARSIQLPGYELVEVLGKGGMGEVWRARQLSLGRTVAIKLLNPDLAKDPDFVRRFEKETAALAALSHPNIVAIIDRGTADAGQLRYFAMEHVEGASLRETVEKGRRPPAEVLGLVIQVAKAIDYAHRRGVIHRDLKPENILVDAAGQAKVVDFGLAGLRGDEQLNLTRAATAMGTLHYMAPEQRRDARSVDERADLYSLGVILYELLVGEVPAGRFRLPSERVAGLDERIDRVVAKALESEPAARYPSAEAMVRDLEAIAAGKEVAALASPALASEESAPARRLIAAAVMVCVAIALGIALWSRRAPAAHAEPAPVLPGDTDAELMISPGHQLRDGWESYSLAFAPGELPLQAFSGEWRLASGALIARVFGEGPGGRPRPWAVVRSPPMSADELEIEALVSVDPTPPARYERRAAPRGEVLLLAEDGSRIAFAVVPGRQPRYELSYRRQSEQVRESQTPDDFSAPPAANSKVRVRLLILDGKLRASAGSAEPLPEVLTLDLPERELAVRVGLGCVEAGCRFDELGFGGHLAKIKEAARP